jgi:hypothetical protein
MVYTNSYPYPVKCNLCHKDYIIIADKADILSWLSGDKYIQNVLSYLSAADRELLISNTCGDCWNKLYPNDKEFEDE